MRSALLLLVLPAVIGCGDDGASGDCPQVAGEYTITAHCVAVQVGSKVTVSQEGCKLTQFDPWTGWSGTVQPGGAMTWSGDAGGTLMTCNGSFAVNRITGSCDPTCDVVLERK